MEKKLFCSAFFCALILSVGFGEGQENPNDFLGHTIEMNGKKVNASAYFWTEIARIPFKRKAELLLPETKVYLNGDRKVDVVMSMHKVFPKGVLGHPDAFGLLSTPHDPEGRVGQWSISTGLLGVREEMDFKSKKGTGRYGFNCWVCHATKGEDDKIIYGAPNKNIYLGLISALGDTLKNDYIIRDPKTKKILTPQEINQREFREASFPIDENSDGRVSIREWRKALRWPDVNRTVAMLLLAGPGRLDDSLDLRLSMNMPLSNHYEYLYKKVGAKSYFRRTRSPKIVLFNPVSIPTNLSGLGVAHYGWSGKNTSFNTNIMGLFKKNMSLDRRAVQAVLKSESGDSEYLSRLMMLDFRNVGTSGLESDDPKGIEWMNVVMQGRDKSLIAEGLSAYQALSIRKVLKNPVKLLDQNKALVQKGREVFTRLDTGRIINMRVLRNRESKATGQYQYMKMLAPLDRSKKMTDVIPVSCATCHTYSPLRQMKKIRRPLQDFQSCNLCHFDHPIEKQAGAFAPIKFKSSKKCMSCHEWHPDFGPLVFSNSWLLPFDADADGKTFGDERGDEARGGIGTDAMILLETHFFTQMLPQFRESPNTYVVTNNARRTPAKLEFSTHGEGWVRVAPLRMLSDTAPYLHNGSVPNLESLLQSSKNRPKKFFVGNATQKFKFDTALPANGNGGHAFGTELSESDKKALVMFLKSIR